MSEKTELQKNEGIDRLRKVRGKDRVTNQSDTEVLNNEQLEKDYSKTRQKKQPLFLQEEEGTYDLIANAAKKTRREIEFKSEILKDAES